MCCQLIGCRCTFTTKPTYHWYGDSITKINAFLAFLFHNILTVFCYHGIGVFNLMIFFGMGSQCIRCASFVFAMRALQIFEVQVAYSNMTFQTLLGGGTMVAEITWEFLKTSMYRIYVATQMTDNGCLKITFQTLSAIATVRNVEMLLK